MRTLGQFQTSLIFLPQNFIHKKSIKSIKSTKSTKTQTSEQVTFLLLDAFYAHKNATFFGFVHLYAFCLLVCFLFACLLFACLFAQSLFVKKNKKKITKMKNKEIWNCPNGLIHITTESRVIFAGLKTSYFCVP